MGMNMLSTPNVDDTNGIWDTRSNECMLASHECDEQGSGANETAPTKSAAPWCKCSHCDTRSELDSAVDQHHSVPSICDLDVRLVNRYIHQQLKKSA